MNQCHTPVDTQRRNPPAFGIKPSASCPTWSLLASNTTQLLVEEVGGSDADLALVKVVDDGVVQHLFELPLGLGAVELKLRATHVIGPLVWRQRDETGRTKEYLSLQKNKLQSGQLFITSHVMKNKFKPMNFFDLQAQYKSWYLLHLFILIYYINCSIHKLHRKLANIMISTTDVIWNVMRKKEGTFQSVGLGYSPRSIYVNWAWQVWQWRRMAMIKTTIEFKLLLWERLRYS